MSVKRFGPFAHRRLALFWVVAIVGLAAPWLLPPLTTGTPGSSTNCTVRSVHDGDTAKLRCSGMRVTVRLFCIDAPEMQQSPWGRESRDALRRMMPIGSRVTLRVRNTDSYGRKVGEIFRDGRNVNLEMVRQGRAVVYGRYCPRWERAYWTAQRLAVNERLGVWSKPGIHQTPWRFRHQR